MEYIEYSDTAFAIENFLTAERARELIAMSEEIGYEEAPITTSRGPVMRKDIRNNMRVIHDSEALAIELDEQAKLFAPQTYLQRDYVGLNERFRFYRYDVGQTFNWHYDGYYERDNGERSQFTLLIYLNDNFNGGETLFEDFSIAPKMGLGVFFWHHQRHCGATVTQGRKYVIRTDVMYSAV